MEAAVNKIAYQIFAINSSEMIGKPTLLAARNNVHNGLVATKKVSPALNTGIPVSIKLLTILKQMKALDNTMPYCC